jgi:urea ABC transporter ATP-binding protein UrtE
MMLEVAGLHSGYGRIPILNDISFSVAAGDFVGLWGHNGMGKTTLMRTLMGYLPATQGRIAFEGADITHAPVFERARLGMGFVPQGREIFPALSVTDNLLMGCVKNPGPPEPKVEAVLEDFPRLKPLLGRTGGLLSGGEQQLLALARCLCGDPRIVLLDEPTEGIQPSIIKDIAKALNEIRKMRKITIVVSEQVLSFAMDVADRLFVIEGGRLVHETSRADTDTARIKQYLSV